MNPYPLLDHHTLAIFNVCIACLELLSTMPDTDSILELRALLEDQSEIIKCLIHQRHFGSDALDEVILDCNNVIQQVKQLEDS